MRNGYFRCGRPRGGDPSHCHSFTLQLDENASPKGRVGTEELRLVKVAHRVRLALLSDPTLREAPNPDGIEPCGFESLKDLRQEGPTDRALRWVAHLYNWVWQSSSSRPRR